VTNLPVVDLSRANLRPLIQAIKTLLLHCRSSKLLNSKPGLVCTDTAEVFVRIHEAAWAVEQALLALGFLPGKPFEVALLPKNELPTNAVATVIQVVSGFRGGQEWFGFLKTVPMPLQLKHPFCESLVEPIQRLEAALGILQHRSIGRKPLTKPKFSLGFWRYLHARSSLR
jgi:hypothetical protein